MKTLKLFTLCTLLLAGAYSCSDDDNNSNDGQYAGTYTLVSVITPAQVDFDQDGNASSNSMDETPCYGQSNIKLNSDRTFTATMNSVLIIEEPECTSQSAAGTWRVENNKIVATNTLLDPAPIDTEYTILSDGTLSITIPGYLYPDRDAEGTAVYTEGTVTFTYQKAQ